MKATNNIYPIIILIGFSFIVISCEKDSDKIESQKSDIIFNPSLIYGSITDIDGNTYKTIKIGSQTWMAENLRTTKLSDGTSIPQIKDSVDWTNTDSPAYCWYRNNPSKYKATYGALYNFYTIETGKLCPEGWHVPSDEEWTELTDTLGGTHAAYYKLKETTSLHWTDNSLEVTNESGFAALPGGSRSNYGAFDYICESAYWWSSTEALSSMSTGRSINYDEDIVFNSMARKEIGFSVRCIFEYNK